MFTGILASLFIATSANASHALRTTLGQAQAPRGADPTSQVLLAVGVCIALVIIGAVAVLLLRRTLFAKGTETEASNGLMDSIRKLRDEGKMSEDEYQAARRAMSARARTQFDAPRPPDKGSKRSGTPRERA
jgi:hypothetical protein